MKHVYTTIPIQIILLILLAFLLTSSTATYQVTGTLVNENDAPIADHQVYLYNSEDEQLASGRTDSQGRFTLSYQAEPTSADPGMGPDSPSEFKLGSSYPNPFNPRTTVPFEAPENTHAVITVYNILGQQVLRTQADVSAGSHDIQVNLGGRLSQGQYILRVEGDGFSLSQAMTFISAGVSSGTSNIVLRSAGGLTGGGVSTQIKLTGDQDAFRLVLEGSAAFKAKEFSIPINQNHDAGEITLTLNEYQLDIIIDGQGTVEQEIVTAKQFGYGTVVRLTAQPVQKWRFAGWSGAMEDLDEVIEIEITQPVTLRASFELAEADFTGKVVSSEDGEGIPLTRLRLQQDSLIYEQTTDEQGAFAFKEVPLGEYEITIRYPLGYRGADEHDPMLLLDRDLSMELIAEPVREITKTIPSGQRDTLSTVTGAIVGIDLSGSSVDVEVEVTQVESPQLTQNKRAVTEPVRVRIGNSNQFKQNGLEMPPAESDSVTITLRQQFDGDYDNGFFLLDSGLQEEAAVLYANGVQGTFVDPIAGKEMMVLEHEFTLPAGISFELTYALAVRNSECGSEDRSLYELPGVLNGNKPLILIHGWQPHKVRCSDFADYDPVEGLFEGLIQELQGDPEISSTYNLYVFKYTSNTPVLSNSEALWQQMNEMGLADKKPVLIGHSMGGLVGRGLIAKHGDGVLDGLITLGTPHEGSPMTIVAQTLNNLDKGALCLIDFRYCFGFNTRSEIIPETSGFLDLDPQSQLINEFRALEGSSDHIFTVAGRLHSRSEASSFVYRQGYSILSYGDSKYSENDGIVPMQSAIPSWSGLREILEAHDHSEVVTGVGSNASSVFGAISPVLKNMQDTGEWHRDTETEVVEVFNPATGRTWMDRNLGASRAATSSTDSQSYGDLYQWGRPADGHQLRNSPTTSTLSSSDQPGHGSFILAPNSPYDWRSPQNDNLWQGVNGVNNPCPAGYRLPTEAEWEEERQSWSSSNAAGAFASPLKLPMAGYRGSSSGSLVPVGAGGDYWSGTVSGTYARVLFFNSSYAGMFSDGRADGFAVRCTKD